MRWAAVDGCRGRLEIEVPGDSPIENVQDTVWIFCGEGADFPAGVFSTRELADEWILAHRLSGVLNEYPLNFGAYDWAIGKHYFEPKRAEQKTARFKERFTSHQQKHFHYVKGVER